MIDHKTKMEQALRGIAACATHCDCCRIHVAVAEEALRPPLCDHGYTVCNVCKLEAPLVPSGTEGPKAVRDLLNTWAPGEPVVIALEHVVDYGAIRPI